MIGLLIYLMIGAIIACLQILSADRLYEEGYMDDEQYIIHKYFKPKAFSIITLFWLPSIVEAVRKTR